MTVEAPVWIHMGSRHFHIADRDTIVAGVSQHLVFEFLPALNALVNDAQGTVHQRSVHQSTELRLITRESPFQGAQGKAARA